MLNRRVLFLQGSVKFGGSKRSLVTMAELLQSAGWLPLVACPGEGWLTDELRARQVEYVVVPFPSWRKVLGRALFSRTLRKYWLPKISSREIALVHSNEFWWGPHAIWLGRRLGVPSIVHLRDGHHDLRKARQYHLGEAAAVLAVSSELRDQFRADPSLYGKTQVVFNGIDEIPVLDPAERSLARARFEVGADELVIGNVGRICERKNQILLLEAADRLQRSASDLKLTVLFAGDADPEYKAVLERSISGRKLQRVRFLGNVSPVGDFYAAIDLLAHTATREGLPRVIPEAMMAGRPVVATISEGVRDALPDRDAGRVVPAGDVLALSSALEELARDGDLRGRIGAAAAARARRVFGLGAAREALLQVYAETLAAHPKTA